MFILLVLPKLISLVCTGSPEMVFLVTTKLSGCLFFNSLPFFRIYSRLREKMKMKYVFFQLSLHESGQHVLCHTDKALTKCVILLISIVLEENRWVYKEVFS